MHAAIRPEVFGNCVLVLTTLAGHPDIRSGNVAHAGGQGSTVLVASDEQSTFRYSEDNVQMGVRIDARRIDELWRRLSGRAPPHALPSCTLLDARRRERWLASVQTLRLLLHPDTPPALRAMQLPLAEEWLIMNLIGERLDDDTGTSTVAPACVKRAIAFIDAHAGQPLTLSDIAAAARCGTRTTPRRSPRSRRAGASAISASSRPTTGGRSANARPTRARSVTRPRDVQHRRSRACAGTRHGATPASNTAATSAAAR